MPDAHEILQLAYVRIGVADLAWWRGFGDVVGFAPGAGPVEVLHWRTDSERDWRIAVETSPRVGVHTIGWETAGAPALAAVRRRLEAHGARLPPVTRAEKDARQVEDMLVALDPDGLRNEIFWGANCALRKPFASPTGTRFASGACGNGHVTVNVGDAAATLAFYTGALGLRLSDAAWMEGHARVYFLRCNARHHSFAFAQMPRPVGTVHVMSDLADLDQLGSVRDRLLDAGYVLNRDLGSHPLDGVVSLYVATPEGYDFELACGTRLINEESWEADKFSRTGIAWGHRKPAPRNAG